MANSPNIKQGPKTQASRKIQGDKQKIKTKTWGTRIMLRNAM